MTARTRTDLTLGWTFKQQREPDTAWLPVKKVPSQIHRDLLDNGKIPDPFLDINERAVQWVGEKSWVYRTTFDGPQPSPDPDVVQVLVFEGLDTFAKVYLNGQLILESDNMFVTYQQDVTHHLRPGGGKNELEVVFESALLRGRQLVEEHKHEHKFLVRQTEAGRVPSRKAQYNWGWDWGPILMTAGIWKPVYLEEYAVKIEDVWVEYKLSEDLNVASGTIHCRVAGLSARTKVTLTLSRDGEHGAKEVLELNNEHLECEFSLQNAKLWYPLGYGAQDRYQVTAEVVSENGAVLDRASKAVGFRKAELVQEPDSHGTSFYFRINGIDVFAGGSCWIPADSIQSDITPERYRAWIRLMAEGNQVMIRIWGGGVYESDALLDACDELGVMVFHDFQFACASYPAYPSFLQTLELEAVQQVRRLRTHPSVVAWAGNNEDYQVQERYKLDYDYENKDPEAWLASSFPARYLYEHFLPRIVEREQPGIIYHPSSPWGDGKPTPDPTVGDIHQWNLWHGTSQKYQEASTMGGRFVSEFGMEAYPHLSTVERYITDPSQRYPGSLPMDFHNKGIGHARRMMTYVVENFRLRYDLASYIHLSQVVQAETMRAAYKSWRRDWGTPGSRKCGGVLVWQLNDCWPTMSWAVVDYYLVPKPAYYAIRRALRSVDVGVTRTYHDWTQTGYWIDQVSQLKTGQVDQTLPARKGTFDVWIASARTVTVQVDIQVSFISVKSGKPVAEKLIKSITARPNGTTDVYTGRAAPTSIPAPEDLTRRFDVQEWDPYVIHAVATVDGNVIASDTAWPDPIKFLDLSGRGVKAQVASSNNRQVVVTADKPVKGFVFEEREGVKLSDNGFDLVPGEQVIVEVQGMSADELKFTYIGADEARIPV